MVTTPNSAGRTNRPTTLKKVAIVLAVAVFLLAMIAWGLRGLFSWSDEDRTMLNLAIYFAIITPGFAVIVWTLPVFWPAKFRAPTGREIGADLLIALMGIPFVIPLLLVSLQGEVMPGRDQLMAAGVAFIGIVFPVIRARKCQSGPSAEDELIALTSELDEASQNAVLESDPA